MPPDVVLRLYCGFGVVREWGKDGTRNCKFYKTQFTPHFLEITRTQKEAPNCSKLLSLKN